MKPIKSILMNGVAALVFSAAAGAQGVGEIQHNYASSFTVPPTYKVQQLGRAAVIEDMNESGLVVGWAQGNVALAFVVGPETPHQFLPVPDGYTNAWAHGINDAGVIVGSASPTAFPELGKAVSWTPDGNRGYVVAFLGQLPGHNESVARDINNNGDIIGTSYTPGLTTGPTVWFNSPKGVLNLSAMGAPGMPREINDRGVIIGWEGHQLFSITTMSVITIPEFPGKMTNFFGWAINNHNEIAGVAVYGEYDQQSASTWSIDEGWQSISTIFGLGVMIAGININDSAVTLLDMPQPGVYYPGLGSYPVSTLLDKEGQSQWVFLSTRSGAVNNAGQIATIARNSSTGFTGAVILTPIEFRPGDLDHNGIVDVNDLFGMLSAWGSCGDPCPPSCAADITNAMGDGTDCMVNIYDLFMLLANFG